MSESPYLSSSQAPNITVTGGGGSVVGGYTDDFSLKIGAAETMGPYDDSTPAPGFALTAAFEDGIGEGGPLVFRSFTSQTATSGTTLIINLPAGAVDNDLLVAIIGGNRNGAGSPQVITPPAGWTQIGTTQSVDTHSQTITYAAYAKIASSEPANWTWTFSNSLAFGGVGTVLAYIGGQIPTNFAISTSGGVDAQIQNYGTLTGDVTGRHSLVAFGSRTDNNGSGGWSVTPEGLTNRTSLLTPASNNQPNIQVWSGLGGSANSQVSKTAGADGYVSFAMLLPPTPIPFTEAVTLSFPSPDFGDTMNTPTDARTALLKVWLANSAGTGVTSPANANGQNDGALATLQTAPAGPTTITMTSDIGVNVGAGLTFTSVLYRGWFEAKTTLITSTCKIVAHSSTAAFADITMFTQSTLNGDTNHLSGDFTFDLFAAGVNTLAKLQSLQIVHSTTDAAAGVTPAVLTVDSGSADIVATSI